MTGRRLDEGTETWCRNGDLMTEQKLDDETEWKLDDGTETWWRNGDLMTGPKLDGGTETSWRDQNLMVERRLDEEMKTWWWNGYLMRGPKLDDRTRTWWQNEDLMPRRKLNDGTETWRDEPFIPKSLIRDHSRLLSWLSLCVHRMHYTASWCLECIKSWMRRSSGGLYSVCPFAWTRNPRFVSFRYRSADTLRSPLFSGSSRLYRLGVSQAQKVKESGDERPRLRAP